MSEVKFYEKVDDELLKFAVIISKTNGKWIFCKHKERETYEVPGGHREVGETIIDAAKRELAEVYSFEEIHSEIEKIIITDTLVDNWTYPFIQPKLIEEAKNRGFLYKIVTKN